MHPPTSPTGALKLITATPPPSPCRAVADLWAERIAAWNSDDLSQLPIYEPGLPEIISEVRGRNLFFTTDAEKALAESDIIFVSVNTPTKTYGIGEGSASDVRNIELAARMIAKIAKSPKIVVEKSTVPVKTGETLQRVLNATGSTSACALVVVCAGVCAQRSALCRHSLPHLGNQ